MAEAAAEEAKVEGGYGLSHLSGGQKTVVVAALIFAVLKLDPAPFYILDELDHALDPQYRAQIALLINELSAQSQFLITTFKPEIIRSASAKIFEVSFKAKKSAIIEINQERALKIVKAAPLCEENANNVMKVEEEYSVSDSQPSKAAASVN